MVKKVYNIILADDHELLISSLTEMINEEDNMHVIKTVNSGDELITTVQNTPFDLCIIDLNMPGLNGLETSKILIKEFPEIKILILTMHKERSLIENMMKLGIKGYLPKSCDKDEFIFAINQLLKNKPYFSSIAIEKIVNNSTILNTHDSSALIKINKLTDREKEIIYYLCEGLNNKKIGEKLFVSHKTIGNHRSNIMQKLDVHNIVELIRFCLKNGVVE